jgi:hypothetical protein
MVSRLGEVFGRPAQVLQLRVHDIEEPAEAARRKASAGTAVRRAADGVSGTPGRRGSIVPRATARWAARVTRAPVRKAAAGDLLRGVAGTAFGAGGLIRWIPAAVLLSVFRKSQERASPHSQQGRQGGEDDRQGIGVREEHADSLVSKQRLEAIVLEFLQVYNTWGHPDNPSRTGA